MAAGADVAATRDIGSLAGESGVLGFFGKEVRSIAVKAFTREALASKGLIRGVDEFSPAQSVAPTESISGIAKKVLPKIGIFSRSGRLIDDTARAAWLDMRKAIIEKNRSRSAFLREKYAHWEPVQRKARIEELAFGNRILREQGVPKEYISQILQSFEPGQITLKFADENTFGLRFYGGISRDIGPFLNPTFPLGNIRDLNALPELNTVENVMQWQVKPGSPYFFGRIRANFGRPGGGLQMYISNFEENLLRPGQ